jgi:iron complex transport system substrate-binding protein
MSRPLFRLQAIALAGILSLTILPAPAQAVESKYPLKISSGGFTSTIPSKPKRIISLSPSATEIFYALGAGSQILAVDSYSNFPANAPVTALSAYEPNIEAIVEKRPDLVLLSASAVKAKEVRSALMKVGIPVVMESDPKTFKDVYAHNIILGRVTDNQSRAAKLNGDMRRSIKAIINKAKGKSGIRFFHELDNTYYSATSETFIGKVYKDFGLVNIADAAAGADTSGYPQLSAEYLVKSDPQIIFLADAQYGESAETVSKRAGWSGISAVKNKKIVELPADITSRWGPRLVDFYAAIGQILSKI